MEWKCNHRTDFAQINFNCPVIISTVFCVQFFIIILASMNCIPFFNFSISTPNRRKACRFCSHYIDSNTEVCAQIRNARSYKFHHLIFYVAVVKNCFYDCKRNILRANPCYRRTCQVNCNNTRIRNIVSFIQKLFCKFAAALADCHCTERTITSMAVRT